MSIGSTIKSRRERKHMSQEELARCAGVTQAAICQYESDSITPKIAVAVRLAKALGMTVEQLEQGD